MKSTDETEMGRVIVRMQRICSGLGRHTQLDVAHESELIGVATTELGEVGEHELGVLFVNTWGILRSMSGDDRYVRLQS